MCLLNTQNMGPTTFKSIGKQHSRTLDFVLKYDIKMQFQNALQWPQWKKSI